ncbi:MAG: hypothetical protein CVU80_00140 [Elusimicrobia bacterium HGW-Elusimicrobia-4]|nr:MAG: hypothetical protein CVU80_00140 [Elusimicrobia bacterium HGW-Elusimicrobia-4]
MKKFTSLLLVVCFVFVMLTGCYGPFKLTKKIYDWNGGIKDKWVREGAFLVLAWIPIYSIGILGDAIIFNSIEFWGGKNPIASRTDKSTRFVSAENKQAVMTFSENKMRLDAFENYRHLAGITIEPQGDVTVAKNSKGEIIMTAKTLLDGSVMVCDASGKQIQTQ